MLQFKKTLTLFLVLLLVFPLLTACQSEPIPALREGMMRLSEGGKSDYRIIISADAEDDVRTMAEEFQSYFLQVTGKKLPIDTDKTQEKAHEILIGRTNRALDRLVDYTALGEEELVIKARDEKILLTGATSRAVAYAVYDYIERAMGVRYLAPDFESVPTKKTLDVPAEEDRNSSPAFYFRTIEGAGASDPKWGVKMRFNSLQSLGSENYRRELFVGGGYGYADWYVHTITKLAEMPDKDEAGNYNTAQPCLTDEGVYQTVLKNVRAWLEKWPDADIVSISQNDGSDEGEMCACEDCTAIYTAHGNVQSAKWVWFVSKIANELKDEYPNVYFDTLAYSFTMMPPTGLEIPENVIIRLAPIGICYEHGTACGDPHGTSAQRTSHKLASALPGWKSLTENIFVWDYSAPFADYWAPLTNFEAMRENIRMFARNGIHGYYMQGAENTPLAELSAYLTAKLLWDPEMTDAKFETHMKEFVSAYYGVTYETMAEYFDLVEKEATQNHFSTHAVCTQYLPLKINTLSTGSKVLDTTLIDAMKDCFERMRAEKKSEEQALHLKKAEIAVKYYEAVCLFTVLDAVENGAIDKAAFEKLRNELFADAKAVGLTEIAEGKKLPEN